MHSCPECEKQTEGTISEGGARWALCSDCFRRLIEEGESDPPGGFGPDIDGWE